MIDFRADLHCHSTCSDGTATPEELIKLALASGLQALAITDHDTVEAYKTALPAARSAGLPLISGVEFSTMHKKNSIHILGYAFKLDHPAIEALCTLHLKRRQDRNNEIFGKLEKLGLPLDRELVGGSTSIGRPHIAKAMMDKGYVKSYQEAFKLYLGEDKPAFSAGEPISVPETIAAIHEAGGVAVIAHPHLITNNQIFQELLEMPFDGIECYYANFMRDSCKRWLKIADRKKWLVTGGSDFHGTVKPNISLGSSWVGPDTFKALHTLFTQNNPCQQPT